MNDNQIEITKKMRSSLEIEGDDSHKDISFEGVNGTMIQICDQSRNYNSQTISIQLGRGNRNEYIVLAAADFDYIVELMHKPLLNK